MLPALLAFLPAKVVIGLFASSGFVSLITAAIKPPSSPAWLVKVWNVANVVSLNIWNARNAVQPIVTKG